MHEEVIQGTLVLEDETGTDLVPPQASTARLTAYDDGRFDLAFATSHQFNLPTPQPAWLRFEDLTNRIIFRMPIGTQDGAVIFATVSANTRMIRTTHGE